MRRPTPSVLACACALAPAGVAGAELVTNGGFETGTFAGWTTTPAPLGSAFGVGGSAHAGASATFFDGGAYDAIAQSLSTAPGQAYELSLWVQDIYLFDKDGLVVTWGGATVFSQSPVLAIETESWTRLSWTVTASGPTTVLSIAAWDAPAVIRVDDVSVVAVPAPGAAALLGLAGLAAARRRR